MTSGTIVTVTTDTGHEVEALITIASKNGRSLILEFDAMIGGWAGQMPVFQDADGRWSSLDGMPLTIHAKED